MSLNIFVLLNIGYMYISIACSVPCPKDFIVFQRPTSDIENTYNRMST